MTLKVDLLPHEKPRFSLDPLAIALGLSVLASGASFYSYGQMLELQIKNINDQRLAVEGECKQCETAKGAIEKERDKLRKLAQQYQLVKNLMRDPLKFANLMSEVSLRLPQAVYIDNLNIEPATNSLSFTGTASGPLPLAAIADTMQNLNDSPYFDATALQTATRKGEAKGAFTFALSTHFDPIAATDTSPGGKL